MSIWTRIAAEFNSVRNQIDELPIEQIDPLAAPPVSAVIKIATEAKTEVTSKEDYLDCTVTISGVPGVPDYFGTGQIRGRGNSTWTYAKKPFKLKLDDDAPLMGMPAFDDWALLANAHESDPTLVNSPLGLAIGARASGLTWTPRSQLAVLYLNNDYRGLYQLTESVKIDTHRVAISKASGTTGDNLTGAYLLEIDRRGFGAGEPGFETTKGVQIIYDDPSGSNTTQAAYIAGAIQDFEDALYDDTNWLDPTLGYAKYVHMPSFIDWYLVNELLSNQDSNFYSSCKLYKLRDSGSTIGQIRMGPLWDMNLSFGWGLGSQEDVHTPEGFYTRNYSDDVNPDGGAIWIDRMFGDPAFTTLLAIRWGLLVASLSDYEELIDSWAARTASEGIADQAKWSYTSAWATEAQAKKDWLLARIYWLSDQFIPPTVVPAKVTGLSANPDAVISEVALTWEPVRLAAVTDYVIQYRVAGDPTWLTFSDGTSVTTSADVTGLDADTDYEFQVAAVNAIGTGTYSDTETATTADASAAVIDTFTRADSSSSVGVADTGQSWVNDNGTYGISGNQAYCVGNGGNGVATVDAGISDCKLTITMVHTDSGDNWQRVIMRAVDGSNYWMLQLQSGGTKLYKVIGGGFTQVGSSGAGPSGNVSVTYEITCDGDDITVIEDPEGARAFRVGATGDSQFNTATKFGIGGASNSNLKWDNMKIEAL